MCKKYLKSRKNLSSRQPKIKARTYHFSLIKIFNFLMLLLIMGGMVSYIALVNRRAISGYKISDLTRQAKLMEAEEEKLELALAEARKDEIIKQKAEAMDLVVLSETEYLEGGSNLARR